MIPGHQSARGRPTGARSWLLAPALAASLSTLLSPVDARAGLLAPILQLIRPQLETRLTEVCLTTAAGNDPDLRRLLQDPCHKLAGPTSRCLIEETDSSGRGLAVMREMVGGQLGDASEEVVKRCLARLFGLPADSLREVPLRELGRRFSGVRQGLGASP